jgi:hypothetical protein
VWVWWVVGVVVWWRGECEGLWMSMCGCELGICGVLLMSPAKVGSLCQGKNEHSILLSSSAVVY